MWLENMSSVENYILFQASELTGLWVEQFPVQHRELEIIKFTVFKGFAIENWLWRVLE